MLSCSLSVRPSVAFVDHIKTNKHIFKIFPPSGSDTILVFPCQRGCRHSDGNPPNGGVEYKRYDKMTIFSQISRSISETVIDRWAHAARQLVSIEFSFHPYRGNKNVGCGTWKRRFFSLGVRITGKLLKIDGYMLWGVWQVLKCLSIHVLLLLLLL